MPHFVMDCSKSVLDAHTEEHIIHQVHDIAMDSGLFTENDIKVRVNPFSTYIVGGEKQDFIHVFGNIMGGRTVEQKAALSKAMVSHLVIMFPGVPNVSMNIRDFEKASYCNKKQL